MLIYVAILIVGSASIVVLVALAGIRLCRAVSQVRERLSELERQANVIQHGIEGIAQMKLSELLSEECDDQLYRATCSAAYYDDLEKGCSDQERSRLKNRTTALFCGSFGKKNLLPSQVARLQLAALRAVKAKHDAADPRRFSRQIEWVYGGNHDGLRKRLRGDVPGLEALLEGQDVAPVERAHHEEHKGGAL